MGNYIFSVKNIIYIKENFGVIRCFISYKQAGNEERSHFRLILFKNTLPKIISLEADKPFIMVVADTAIQLDSAVTSLPAFFRIAGVIKFRI